MEFIELDIHHHIATISLNRPQLSNAFDNQMIAELIQTLTSIVTDENIRVVVLQGNGKHFSAGADLNWMQRMVHFSEEDNFNDAMQLAKLMNLLYTFPKPTIARVQGATIGGGIGLVACCDIKIASQNAFFRFSEVSIGLIPAVISPYIINVMGERHANRYFLTAEKIDSLTAKSLGLIDEVCQLDDMDNTVNYFIELLLKNSPDAISHCKQLTQNILNRAIDEELIKQTAQAIARTRTSTSGQHGLQTFLNKRKPDWVFDYDN